ncbi:hypothetical protein JTB14_022259 [Gonioctena quinquepunctata]|nr:hypothetical protein JTB14_022259 [Gonioctena quinquepunctata]
MMVFGQKDSVPETISTPMVEEQSNSSMDHQEHLEKDEQSIKKRISINISKDVGNGIFLYDLITQNLDFWDWLKTPPNEKLL